MAFIDDRDWVISHVRHCFITSDETGFCEHVLGKDEEWKGILNDDERSGGRNDHLPIYAYGASEDGEGSPPSPFRCSSISSSSSIRSGTSSDTGILPNSLDIHFDGYGTRPAPKSEPPAPKPDPPPKIRTFPSQLTAARNFDPDDFDKQPVKLNTEVKEGDKVSSLMKLLSVAEQMPADPFFEFAQFDGASHPGVPVKRINIYLSMCEGEERWEPMPIVVQWIAKVSDLIGLICHHYVQSRRVPPLNNSTPAGYSLYMADDDGLVEEDFAPLDSREPISKFDFPNLALVEIELPHEEVAPPTIITVNIPQRGWGKIQVENDGLLMKEILKIILAKRRISERRGIEYILERQAEPGKPIDLERPLKEVGTLEFCLIRLNSSGREEPEPDEGPDLGPFPLPPLPPLPGDDRRYKVVIVKKFKANTEAHLDISGERLDLRPLVCGAAKPLFVEMENVIDADIIAEKAKGTATLRVRYSLSGGDHVKQFDLKCVSMIAHDIVDRIEDILNQLPANRKNAAAKLDRKSDRWKLT